MRLHHRADAALLRPAAVLLFLLIAIGLGALPARAEVEGIPCAAEPTDEIIEYGDLITCTINPKGDNDLFRFQGSTGERIIVSAARPSGGVSPCIELFRPSGGASFAMACANVGGSFTVTGVLDETGPWTIVVHDGGNNHIGPYNLSLERLAPNEPVTSPSAEPVDYGATITGEINPAGDADIFLIGGGVGSTISIQTAKLTGLVHPCLFLYDPAGVLLASDCSTKYAFSVTAAIQTPGPHTVYVADRANVGTGTFSLTLQCLSGTCPNLHRLTITEGPAGTPNPVKSANTAALDVTADDTFAHTLAYAWTASCPAPLGSNGTFSDATAKSPSWTAPANTTGVNQECTMNVTVSDGAGLTKQASYVQTVFPVLPPDITVTPMSIDFGTVPIGGSSAPQTVTIRNDGLTDDLLVKTVRTGAGIFEKTSDNCTNTTLPPGQSCTVAVVFAPTTLGQKSSVLQITSTDPDEATVRVTLVGTGAAASGSPDIAATPASLDFGSVTIASTSAAQTVTVTNEGVADLLIRTIARKSTYAALYQITQDNCSNTTVPPGQTCTVSVVFKPTTAGVKPAELWIPSNDPDEDPLVIPLTGTGVTGGGGPAPDITVTPLSIDFGSVALGSTSAPQAVTIANDGAGDLLIQLIVRKGGYPGMFLISDDHCTNVTLAPGQSCTVSVAFKPTALGLRTTTLSIPSNDPDENPFGVGLSGTGIR